MNGNTLKDLRSALERKKGRQEQILKTQATIQLRVRDTQRDIRRTEKAQVILQEVAQQTQEELRYHINEIVSLALVSIFDDPYEFQVNFVVKRGKTEAELLFTKDGEPIEPMSSAGGGVIDVAAFALRVALWRLRTPKLRATMILDEPFRFLSTNLQPKASELLRQLSDKLNLQFIIVTHEEELVEAADRIFHVGMTKRRSVVTTQEENQR